MERFLSEENINLHKYFLNTLKLKYSVLEKSISGISGKSLSDIKKMKLPKQALNEVLNLKGEILAHEIYFASFNERYEKSKRVNLNFSSGASFLYEIYTASMNFSQGYLLIYLKNNQVAYEISDSPADVFMNFQVILAVDLFEHAYFKDYGFDREKYLENALAYLAVSKLDFKN